VAKLNTHAVLLDVVVRPKVLGRRRSMVKWQEEYGGSMNGSFQCCWPVTRARGSLAWLATMVDGGGRRRGAERWPRARQSRSDTGGGRDMGGNPPQRWIRPAPVWAAAATGCDRRLRALHCERDHRVGGEQRACSDWRVWLEIGLGR
jgi:hypothetical protein